MAQRYFKIRADFGLICQYNILIPYVESFDEANSKVYNKQVIELIL